jgi:putative ABC transport system permease protein
MNRIAFGVLVVAAVWGTGCKEMHRAIMGVHSRSVRVSADAPEAAAEKMRGLGTTFEAVGLERQCGNADERALCVSSDWFQAAESRPMLGRAFLAEDPAGNVMVLSHAYWQRKFGGDPGIIGRAVDAGSTKRTVVGILPESSTRDSDVYLPRKGSTAGDVIIARLAPGVTAKQAQAALDTAGIKAHIE